MKSTEGFPPMRRVLSLKVRKDGAIRAMRMCLRGGTVTYRRTAGLVLDGNAAAIYSKIFSNTNFDSIHVRVWAGGRWVNPQEVKYGL